jgi:DNA polymerase I-like protein with 3'-5' exonuclease and polymerase domains
VTLPIDTSPLVYWITEREAVRRRREAGAPAPWSEDEVFQRERFCNVERERDAVTRWIREHWRDPHRDDPDLWFLMVVARLGGNDPRILSQITTPLPWDRDRYLAEMAAKGLKVGVRGYRTWIGPTGVPTHEHLARDLFDLLWAARDQLRPRPGDSCQAFFERLRAFDGLGTFLAAQVVADAKFTPPLADASDWWTFVASGPGSRRGLNVVMGRDPEAPCSEPEWLAAFRQLSAAIEPQLAELGLRLSASDLQNCLCEVFKYHRAKTTGRIARPFRPEGTAPKRRISKPSIALKPAAIPPAPALPPKKVDLTKFRYLARPFIIPAADKRDELRLVFDIETDGLLDSVTKVHCIVIGDLNSDQVFEYGPTQIADALAHLARAAYLTGHNITRYDLPVLQRRYNWAPPSDCTILDTLVASRLILPHLDDLDATAKAMGGPSLGKLHGSYSLEAWGARLGIPKIGADITDWSQWTPEIQARCVGDVALGKALWRFLQPHGYSQPALALEHRVAAICDRITADGVPFDVARAERLHQRWTARRAELAAQLSAKFPGTKNLNSHKQIAALLEARGWIPTKRTEKTGQPQIDDELLESISTRYPEFAGLAEYHILGRRIAQLAGGKKGEQAWCKKVGADGRIHGGLVHIGTPHSRAKHLAPNLAQVPNPKKAKPFATECRALFRHPGDWVFVCCDQASLQDRAYAHHLAEFDGGAYAQAFLAGIDRHWHNAIALGLVAAGTERDKESKLHNALREGAKPFHYAFLFGAGAGRCGEILRETVRIAQQIEPTYAAPTDGKQARDRFIAATPGLQRLRYKLEAQVERQQWLPGLDGRRIPCRAQYTALNYALTSIEAIVCKRWLVNVYDELHERFRYGWDGEVVIPLWTHDEIACCCRPEIADQVGEIMVRHAKEAGEHYGLRVPLAAEYKIGKSWAGDDAIEIEPDAAAADDLQGADIEDNSLIEAVIPLAAESSAVEVHAEPADAVDVPLAATAATTTEPPPFAFTFEEIHAAFARSRDEAPGHGNGHDKGGNGFDHRAGGAKDYRDNSHPPEADDAPDAGKPYGPIRAALAAKGYKVARSFAFTVPGEAAPLFHEDRYELQAGITPSQALSRKTSRYRHRKDGKELSGTGPRRIIYHWPAILQAGPGAEVFITEGANKCDALNSASLLATAAPYHQWGPECVSALAGRNLIYLEDHDHPDANGRITSQKLSADAKAKLAQGAASFRIVPALHLWKNLGRDGSPVHGWDVKDWCEAGGEVAKLRRICREVPADRPKLTIWNVGELLGMGLPPPRGWLYGRQLCRRFLSGLVAPGDAGKTTLRLTQAIELAANRELLGHRIHQRCRVLIVSLEDDHDELWRRLLAACCHHSIDRAEIDGWLFSTTVNGPKLVERVDGGVRLGALDGMLRESIEELRPDLVVLDPFVKLHALVENDNADMDFVCTQLVKLANDYDIAIDCPAHTRKGELEAGNSDNRRGASAQRDAGRLDYTLTHMTEDEAKRFGIDPDERKDYVRLDRAKANIVRRSIKASWFRMVSVQLGNATEHYPEGDEVQAIEPWIPPAVWAGVTQAHLDAILDAIDAGMEDGRRYSNASNARDRAAWLVVHAHLPDKAEAQCREIIQIWLKNGGFVTCSPRFFPTLAVMPWACPKASGNWPGAQPRSRSCVRNSKAWRQLAPRSISKPTAP